MDASSVYSSLHSAHDQCLGTCIGGLGPHQRQNRPLLRAPVPAPQTSSTWEQELWQLTRLYGTAGPCVVESAGDDSTRVSLVQHCTDPDWEAEAWAPEGINVEIVVPAEYPGASSAAPTLCVLGPDYLPQAFKDFLPLLFAECFSKAQPHSCAVYKALRHVDRHLVALWRKVEEAAQRAKAEPFRAKEAAAATIVPGGQRLSEVTRVEQESAPRENAKSVSEPWTMEEQARLEDALVEFRGEADSKVRWAAIAEHVGGGRSRRDCVERFRKCREIALSRVGAPSAEIAQKEAPQALEQHVWSADEIRRMGLEVRFLGVSLEGIATLLPSKLRLQVVCGRCKKPADMESTSRGTDPQFVEMPCPVCKQQLGLRVAPAICHGGCTAIAHVLGVGCHPIQFLRSDFLASCGECTQQAVVHNLGPGYRKRSSCAGCYAKQNLAVEGADVLGNGLAQWRQIAADQAERMSARRQLQEARKHERELGIKVGQPLPEQGSCKHFRKSHRWMRFPCCGRAFPCGECHDEATDHPHEWANRMLCGHCSFEQPFCNDKCSHCGAAATRSRSAYWEGGQGCRSRQSMATSDTRKYKGLSKTTSRKKAAK